MISYDLMRREGPRLKAELTRAKNKPESERREAVEKACRRAVSVWGAIGAWPDNWHRWQAALYDTRVYTSLGDL